MIPLTIETLLISSEKKGFVTDDEIINVCDTNKLSLKQFDELYNVIQKKGILIKEDNEVLDDGIINKDIYISDKAKYDYKKLFNKVVKIDPSLKFYIDLLKRIEPLKRGEERELVYQAKKNNIYARDRLISTYLKVTVRMAYYYYKTFGYNLADSVQYGNIGLIIALQKIPLESKYKYSTYAPWWIRQKIERMNCFMPCGMNVPMYFKNEIIQLIPIINNHECYLCNNGRSKYECNNLINTIKDKKQYSTDKIELYLKILQPNNSVEELILVEHNNLLSDHNNFIEKIDDDLCLDDLDKYIKYLINDFNDREKQIIKMRFGLFGEDLLTLEEVGAIFNVTRERIRQIESKILKKMKITKKKKILEDFL